MLGNNASRVLPLMAGIAIAAGSLAAPGSARAERKNPLADAPAVRHRLLLVNKRFEVTPAFESSVNADYKHTVGGGLKLEYHFSDMLSFGAVGFYGRSFNTGLVKRILDTLPVSADPEDPDPTPTRAEYRQHLNEMPVHGGAYATWTPWYGKLAAFGKAFVNFDFYFSGGVSFAQLTNDCDRSVCYDSHPGEVVGDELPDNDPNDDPPLNDGTKLGVYMGGGIHVFLNNFIALDLTVRNYWFADNPSGLDFNADLAVKDDDPRFLTHLFMGVGVSVFLPTKVQRTP
jgi:outer membrane beta-barrel protein